MQDTIDYLESFLKLNDNNTTHFKNEREKWKEKEKSLVNHLENLSKTVQSLQKTASNIDTNLHKIQSSQNGIRDLNRSRNFSSLSITTQDGPNTTKLDEIEFRRSNLQLSQQNDELQNKLNIILEENSELKNQLSKLNQKISDNEIIRQNNDQNNSEQNIQLNSQLPNQQSEEELRKIIEDQERLLQQKDDIQRDLLKQINKLKEELASKQLIEEKPNGNFFFFLFNSEAIQQLQEQLEKEKQNLRLMRRQSSLVQQKVADIQEDLFSKPHLQRCIKRRYSDINQTKLKIPQPMKLQYPIFEDDKESDKLSNRCSSEDSFNMEDLQKTIEELKNQIDALNEEIGEYEENQKFYIQKADDLALKFEALQKTKNDLDGYYKLAYQQNQQLQQAVEQLNLKIQEKDQKINEFEYALKVQKEIEDLMTSDLEKNKLIIQDHESKLLELVTSYEQLMQQKIEIEQYYKLAYDQIEQFQQNEEQLQLAIKQKEEQILQISSGVVSNEINSSNENLEASQNKISFLEKKLAIVEQGEKQWVKASKELEQKLKGFESENKNLKERLGDIEGKYTIMENDYQSTCLKRDELTSKLATIEENKKKQDKEIEKERQTRRKQMEEMEQLKSQLQVEKKKYNQLVEKQKAQLQLQQQAQQQTEEK